MNKQTAVLIYNAVVVSAAFVLFYLTRSPWSFVLLVALVTRHEDRQ